jgi:phospholipid N-methyltransferase
MDNSTTIAGARRPPAKPSPWGLFFQGFLKHPVMVGAVLPSSSHVIRRMLAQVDWQRVKVFVEYGPGVGTFCQPVLDRLPADAQLISIDTNPDFIAYLNDTIRDSRFEAVLGSATDVANILADRGHDGADYVLSGLPFSTLPPGVGDAIARATANVLQPDGTFLVYQYRPKCRSFFEPYLPAIEHAMEWRNIPPTQLYWARRTPASEPESNDS